MEVSERLVGSPAFKAGGTGDPRPAGSIPVHLRRGHRPLVGEVPGAVVRWPPGCAGFPSISAGATTLRLDVLVVYFRAMKKFFLFVLVAVLVAWVAKKVREV